MGIPDPSSMASRVFAGSLPPDRRAVSRSADSACEKMHETSAPRSPRSVAAGDVEDGRPAPDRCEVDLAAPEHAADVVVAEGHEVVARGGDEGLPAAVRRGDEEELVLAPGDFSR